MSVTLKPFKVWIRLYAITANKDANVIEKKLAPTIRHFNSRFATIKSSNGFNSADMCALMYFAFLHNPLKINPTDYGKIDNITACVREFAWFCREHTESVKKIGVIATVVKHAPKTTIEIFDKGLDDDVKRYL
jgi:hypothetical protein